MTADRDRHTPIRGIRIDRDLWAAVKAKAAASGTSVSEVVRRLLERWLSE